MSFERWCAHYGYAPDSEEAAVDYRRYLEGLELVRSLYCPVDALHNAREEAD
ncbi:hypothetical protein [Sediminicurvatus halobius]|uniref:hypothetical protein n=1 Tax=Sediminicurvatus halobius TaxID=2182432 RepID=UPI001304C2D5|nr:hypothetical protein [Spiribacter halobius]UEX78632.1 hypothetical protein LMH63_03015 [Spiribacter halobius]